jgi:KDO2-lipid IV(A) lauroyltransferase
VGKAPGRKTGTGILRDSGKPDGTKLPPALLVFVARLFQRLPHGQALNLGRHTGDLLRLLLKKKTSLARRNLESAFPELRGSVELEDRIRDIYRHFGMMGAEFLRFPVMDEPWLRQHVQVSGLEHVFSLLGQGKGVLAFSAHFGNWELAIKRLALDIPEQIHVVIRRIKDPNVHRFVEEYRESYGGAVSLLQDQGPLPIFRILKKNGIVVTVLDQNAGRDEGVFTPFFGRPACTYTSVARIAVRQNIPLLPVFDARVSDVEHQIWIGPPIAPPDTDTQEAVENLTQACTEKIEKMVRRYPEQWIWMHNRWKTRPIDPEDGVG